MFARGILLVGEIGSTVNVNVREILVVAPEKLYVCLAACHAAQWIAHSATRFKTAHHIAAVENRRGKSVIGEKLSLHSGIL